MTILSLASSLTWLSIHIMCTCNLVQVEGWVHGFVFVWYSIFPFGLRCFLLYIAHQVGSSPSFTFWIGSLHLWLTFRSKKNPALLLFPWWGTNYISQCYVILLPSLHYFPWHVDIMLLVNGIRILVDVLITNPTWTNLVLCDVSFHKVATMMAT